MKTNQSTSSASTREREYIPYIVEGIKEVLQYNMPVLWSWGAEKFRAGLFNNMPALMFKVSGFLHEGDVVVAYNGGADLYEVYCLNEDKRILKWREEVYFDELIEAIDKLVEKDCPQEEYDRKLIAEYGEAEIEAIRNNPPSIILL